MFNKAFRIKSNSILKGSERKKLLALLRSTYPQLEDFIPPKGELSALKVVTFKGDIEVVYCLAQNPIFFTVEGKLLPTVYTLWQNPTLLPLVATNSMVLNKLRGGADLMLPGIEPSSLEVLGEVKAGDICAICLTGTAVAAGVGMFLMPGSQLQAEPKRGKAVFPCHLYKDELWAHGNKSHPQLVLQNSGDQNLDHQQEEPSSPVDQTTQQVENLSLNGEDTPAEKDMQLEQDAPPPQEDVRTPAQQMDDLLMQCFLSGLKSSGNNLDLPVLSSTFYKVNVLGHCPPNHHLDIKKSSFKKLSNFLKEMQVRGLLEVKELTKGVESIVAVNLRHELLRDVSQFPANEPPSEPPTQEQLYTPPEIKELFSVSAQVLPLFQPSYRKGDALTPQLVRQVLTDYVKKNELQRQKLIGLDGHLTDVLLSRGETHATLTWEEAMTRLLGRMQHAVEVCFPGEEPQLRKGLLEPITVSLGQRTGNKKVTLISNLEPFRIDPSSLAHQLQLLGAASTSVGPAPAGRKGFQVLVQGNQIRHVAALLLETYKIPKKYIQGIENVGKKKR